MSFFSDLFGTSGIAYPTRQDGPVPPACGTGPHEAAERDGFFNKIFAPKALKYPVPGCGPDGKPLVAIDPQTIPAAIDPRARIAAPASGQAPAIAAPIVDARVAPTPVIAQPALPVTVAPVVAPALVVQPAAVPVAQPVAIIPAAAPAVTAPLPPASVAAPVVTATVATERVSEASSATVAPAAHAAESGRAPIVPSGTKLLRAHVFNPEFAPSFPTAQQAYLEDVLEESVTTRMVRRDGAPVAFVVPEGCDSLDLLYGPVEVNPGCGCDSDLDQIVIVGDAKLSANVGGIDRPLVPGEQVMLTVPWRAASWVQMDEGRLRMQVLAHFYKAQTQPVASST